MNRTLFLLPMALGAAAAFGQAPDVAVKVDVNAHYRSELHGDTDVRWYDSMGHHSTVGLQFGFEPGFRAFVSERLQRIPHDGDPEQLDEYYVEDPGIWRVGKQYLPFGRQNILRESARAARGDTRLILETIPVSLAICDNGTKRTRGVVGRVGNVVGVSFAFGNSFGIQGTDLDMVRNPEDAPGVGRGYRTALGLDFARHFKIYTVQAEAVMFRRGQTDADPNTEVSDLLLTLQPSRYRAISLGWSRDYGQNADYYRLQGRFLLTRSTWLEPIVKFKGSSLWVAGASVRVKF